RPRRPARRIVPARGGARGRPGPLLRLRSARRLIAQGLPLGEVAAQACFADQTAGGASWPPAGSPPAPARGGTAGLGRRPRGAAAGSALPYRAAPVGPGPDPARVVDRAVSQPRRRDRELGGVASSGVRP